MQSPFLTGEHIYLRPLTQADATVEYANWMNNSETTRYLETGRFPASTDSLAKYIARYEDSKDALFLAIVLKDGDRHIGNIKLEPINWIYRSAVLGILIGRPEERGKGFGGEAIKMMLHHAFDGLNLNRVELGVSADNVAAITCFSKIGFVKEGRFREAIFCNGVYVDRIWMSVLAEEFRKCYNQCT